MSGLRRLLVIGFVSVALKAHGLTLQESIRLTLETHPEVLAARHEYSSRGAEVRQAKSGYLPSVDLAAGIGRQSLESQSTGGDEVSLTRHETSLSARQMLFDGFATSEEVNRQQARASSAQYKAKEVEDNTALRVTEVYLNVLRFQDLLNLARDTLYEHQNIHDQMVLRNKSGVGSKADLDQITARLALAQSNMITAQSNLLDAKTNFYRVTGIYPDFDKLEAPVVKATLPTNIETAESMALQQHPTLLSASADVDSAEAQYDASESVFWPRLQLEADRRWDQNIDGVEGGTNDAIVALRMTYNLYAGGGDKARRKQTAYQLEAAREIRNNTQRQVVESLRLSWSAYRTIADQLKYLKMHVRAASDTKSAYRKQFNIGRRTLLDLLNTENEVVDSRRALINALYDQTFSQYRVFNSMGQLLEKIGSTKS
ncbi:TolC family outer membrane protein [Aestuariicella hydrocarbonica]|uniref:TolC family outer membrane protein n=1 Tax=Pseudomaricurvus hydrocarbonicus TaxID=1470433 RepID=A0A9E5MQ51_9GAMM|nr:TolC family outer membrane protein [Aestuariicella hydrocarbonica]NHO68309.1 TolC family outer membrane protein [Aestuariicella hydrocarbonica]